MVMAPAVIVHDAGQGRLAVGVGRPVVLLSAVGAGCFGGCLWWRALLSAVGFGGLSVLDCGDSVGRAVEAMRLGLPGILVRCDALRFGVVAGLAEELGVVVLGEAPAVLDLGVAGAERRLAGWLG